MDSHTNDVDSHTKEDHSRSKDDNAFTKDDDYRTKDDDSGTKDDDSRTKDDSYTTDDDLHTKDDDSRTKDDNSRTKDDDSHTKDDDSRSKDDDSRTVDDDTCTAKFLRLQERLPAAGAFKIRFTALHRIARPSCLEKHGRDKDYSFMMRCSSKLNQEESDEASKNLWKLGRSVQSFDKQDWNELIGVLAYLVESDLQHGKPHEHFHYLENLEKLHLLYKNRRYLRDEEDQILRRDCEILRQQSENQ